MCACCAAQHGILCCSLPLAWILEHVSLPSLHNHCLQLQVVGQTFQSLESVSPRTYIGSGKTLEVEGAVDELDADTVIFDDELTPGQLRNLEKAWGDKIRLCDRTALILDIFSQRAATKEGQLQVGLLRGLAPASSLLFVAAQAV